MGARNERVSQTSWWTSDVVAACAQVNCCAFNPRQRRRPVPLIPLIDNSEDEAVTLLMRQILAYRYS